MMEDLSGKFLSLNASKEDIADQIAYMMSPRAEGKIPSDNDWNVFTKYIRSNYLGMK